MVQQCPFQYYLNNSRVCTHNPIFPIKGVPILIYILLPFTTTLCNIGGISPGIFKILLFMTILNYPVSNATFLTYAVTAGGALANFLNLITLKHPIIKSSLIDHNVTFALLPGLLFGTSVGVIINKLMFDLLQNILVIISIGYFSYQYLSKYFKLKEQAKDQQQQHHGQSPVLQKYVQQQQNYKNQQIRQFYQYEKGSHWKQILIALFLFITLQTLGVIAQGYVIEFQTCSQEYNVAYILYTIFTVIVSFVVYLILKKRLQYYQKIQHNYHLKLNQPLVYLKIVLSSLGAGLFQGILGFGSGLILILALLNQNQLPQVASAVSGYAYFFIGTASLVEAYILKQIRLNEAGFLYGISFVGSFIFTTLVRNKMKGKKQFDRIIMLSVSIVCILSFLGVIINIIITLDSFGIDYMLIQKRLCK